MAAFPDLLGLRLPRDLDLRLWRWSRKEQLIAGGRRVGDTMCTYVCDVCEGSHHAWEGVGGQSW